MHSPLSYSMFLSYYKNVQVEHFDRQQVLSIPWPYPFGEPASACWKAGGVPCLMPLGSVVLASARNALPTASSTYYKFVHLSNPSTKPYLSWSCQFLQLKLITSFSSLPKCWNPETAFFPSKMGIIIIILTWQGGWESQRKQCVRKLLEKCTDCVNMNLYCDSSSPKRAYFILADVWFAVYFPPFLVSIRVFWVA